MGQRESNPSLPPEDSNEQKDECRKERRPTIGNYFSKKREKWEKNFLLKNLQKIQELNISEEEKIQQQKNLMIEAQDLLDEKVFSVIVSINPLLLQFGTKFQNDLEIVKIALRKNWKTYEYVDNSLKKDKEIRKIFIIGQIESSQSQTKDLIQNLDILDMKMLNLYIEKVNIPLNQDEYDSIFKYFENSEVENDLIDWSMKNYFHFFIEYCLKNKKIQIRDKETILHFICRKGSLELCEKVLELYPEIKDQKNIYEKTCLNISNTYKHKKLTKLLKGKYNCEYGPTKFLNLNFEFVSYILSFTNSEDINILKKTSKVFRAALNLESSWRRKCVIEMDYFASLFRESWEVTYFVLESCKKIKEMNLKNIHLIQTFENKNQEKSKDFLTSCLLHDIEKRQYNTNPMNWNETSYELEWSEPSLKLIIDILLKQENGKFFLNCFTNNRNDLYVNKYKTDQRLISLIFVNPIKGYLSKNKQIENQYIVKLVSKDVTGYFTFFEASPQENQKFVEIQNIYSDFTTFNLSLDPPDCQIGGRFHFDVYYRGKIDIEILNINVDAFYNQKKLGNLDFHNVGTVKSSALTEFSIPIDFRPKGLTEEVLGPLIDDYYEHGSVIFEFQGYILVKVMITQFKYPIQFTQEKKF